MEHALAIQCLVGTTCDRGLSKHSRQPNANPVLVTSYTEKRQSISANYYLIFRAFPSRLSLAPEPRMHTGKTCSCVIDAGLDIYRGLYQS